MQQCDKLARKVCTFKHMENSNVDDKTLEKFVEKVVWKETMFDADYEQAEELVRPLEEKLANGEPVEYCKGAFSKFKYW